MPWFDHVEQLFLTQKLIAGTTHGENALTTRAGIVSGQNSQIYRTNVGL